MRTRHLLLVLATVSLAILLTGCQKPDAESAPQTTSPAGQSARTGDDVTLHLYPSTFRAYPGRDVRAGRSWTERGGHETVPS
jgi:hypothetical protein